MNWPWRHVAPARGEHLQHLGEVRGQLDLGHVVAGPVGQADEVRVAFDQARHHGAAAQVDDLGVAPGVRVAPHRGKAPLADADGVDDRVAVVHGVDQAVHEHQLFILVATIVAAATMRLGGRRQSERGRHRGGRLKQMSTRKSVVSVGGHAQLHRSRRGALHGVEATRKGRRATTRRVPRRRCARLQPWEREGRQGRPPHRVPHGAARRPRHVGSAARTKSAHRLSPRQVAAA